MEIAANTDKTKLLCVDSNQLGLTTFAHHETLKFQCKHPMISCVLLLLDILLVHAVCIIPTLTVAFQ